MQSVREILQPSHVNFVVYHGNCTDGMGAAFCAYLLHTDSINYHAAKHLQPGQDDLSLLKRIETLREEKPDNPIHMLMVDYAYPRDFLLRLNSLVNKLIVLDHHVSAMRDVGDLPFCYFDMDRSGAMLAWDYFFPNEPAPLLIGYIQDRDLWKWNLSNSSEFSCGLDCYYPPLTTKFSELLKFVQIRDGKVFCDDSLIQTIIEHGKVVKKYTEGQVELSRKRAYSFTTKNGLTHAIVNESQNVSRLGNILANDHDFAFIFHAVIEDIAHEGILKVSMRSTGDKDCTLIAKMFGGGGHKNAAAFIWPGNYIDLIQRLRNDV